MFNNLSERFTGVIKSLMGQSRLTKDNIQESLSAIRNALLEADVALPVIKTFLEEVQTKAIGQEVIQDIRPGDAFIKVVYDELVKILGEGSNALNLHVQPPVVIMLVGLQGSGKTTTVAKLAHWLKVNQKKSALLTSLDIYRPAAIEQLQTLAQQVGACYYPSTINDDPIKTAKAAIAQAKNQFLDSVIIDTAGRLHIDQKMMD